MNEYFFFLFILRSKQSVNKCLFVSNSEMFSVSLLINQEPPSPGFVKTSEVGCPTSTSSNGRAGFTSRARLINTESSTVVVALMAKNRKQLCIKKQIRSYGKLLKMQTLVYESDEVKARNLVLSIIKKQRIIAIKKQR
jgi:hypothetical protein